MVAPRTAHWSRLMWMACLTTALWIVGSVGTVALAQDDADAPPADKAAQDTDDKDPGKNIPENPFPNRFKAPELEGGAGWLNCGGEISLKDLRGKVVLIDFWTFCCINCIHVLPDLKFLEQKYGKELVVIGVHSAKFDNEKETENIRRAIVRYEIEHPVVNDNEMTIWRRFGVRSWPTLVLIDPEGMYCGYVSGEGQRELLDNVIAKLIDHHRAKGTLDETPVNFSLERSRVASGPLRFPGKLLADAPGGRLFISDSNHNRIVVAGLDGKLQATIGSGKMGRDDGDFQTATFDHPQGMALDGDTLYVADTENHLLRKIDLKARQVTTIAGTGVQGQERFRGGPGLKLALNSPWDLWLHSGRLFIAMAGPHQIWTYDLKSGDVQPYAGSGREDILNGSLRIAGEPGADFDANEVQRVSAFAQPSGLASDGESLYVVDSEGSAIRKVPLSGEGKVTTIAGTSDLPGGRSLFEFGDKDGTGEEARFQHPLGIAWHDGLLYVADSYNHKVKSVHPETGEVRTVYGDGKPGTGVKPLQFSEPAGLAIANGALYVADTNNHQIKRIDLAPGDARVLEIVGLTPPNPPRKATPVPDVTPTELTVQRLAATDSLVVELNVELPEDYKLNPQLPPSFRVQTAEGVKLVAAEALEGKQEAEFVEGKDTIRLKIPLVAGTRQGDLNLQVTFGYCRAGTGGLCKLKTLAWKIPVQVDPQSPRKQLGLSAKVE
ncbi:MAG: thioredoxin-like domain-containing protein [Planctomycetaceae bacterium]